MCSVIIHTWKMYSYWTHCLQILVDPSATQFPTSYTGRPAAPSMAPLAHLCHHGLPAALHFLSYWHVSHLPVQQERQSCWWWSPPPLWVVQWLPPWEMYIFLFQSSINVGLSKARVSKQLCRHQKKQHWCPSPAMLLCALSYMAIENPE